MTVSDSMPVRIAATGPLRDTPADVYLSGRTSGLAHIRLTVNAPTAEAAKQAITAHPDWPATAAHTGAGIGTKTLAGTPTLSLTVATDRLDATLDFLCAAIHDVTWPEPAEHPHPNPKTTARKLATGPEPNPTGRTHLTVLADIKGTPEPPETRETPAAPPPERQPTVSRAGNGDQTWYAACWDLPKADAESTAAAELFLFALGGAPFSPLFQALRDDLGISYGPRTSVQPRRRNARAWLELTFPTTREPDVQATIERTLATPDARRWMNRSRNVLLSSVLAALDFGSGQADALALGRVVGSPTYAWDVAAQLTTNNTDELRSRVPTTLHTLSTASIGTYSA
jgi:hypothetical protein